MKKQSRRKFTPEFKAKVALEAVKNEMTLAQLSQKFEISPILISRWKSEFIERMALVFSGKHYNNTQAEHVETERLFARIGQLKVENDFLKKVPGKYALRHYKYRLARC
jgi:transposase